MTSKNKTNDCRVQKRRMEENIDVKPNKQLKMTKTLDGSYSIYTQGAIDDLRNDISQLQKSITHQSKYENAYRN